MSDEDRRVSLEPLDPGVRSPGFWIRFHSRVMEQAAGELERRRREVELGIAEVVFAWRRTLVPVTLLAAALAGVLLATGRDAGLGVMPMSLEEALVLDAVGEPLPTLWVQEPELDEVAFLTMGGGR